MEGGIEDGGRTPTERGREGGREAGRQGGRACVPASFA